MSFTTNAWVKAADSTPESDSALDKPWQPLADNDDDGGDHATEVDPEI